MSSMTWRSSAAHALSRELHMCGIAVQALTKDLPKEQLERAKLAAISSVYMNLESRAVVAEDIGRQILTYGHRSEPHLACFSFCDDVHTPTR